jgi:hypothetical protein
LKRLKRNILCLCENNLGEFVFQIFPSTIEGTVVTREGTVVTREGTVVTREGTVVTREGTVVTRESTVVTREGTVVTRESTVVTREGDSGGKVNILGGDSVGHFEKEKVYMNMCLIDSGYRDRAV